MILKSWIVHGLDLLVLGEEVGDDASASIVDFHACGEGLYSAQDQPALEWRENRSRAFLQESELIRVLLPCADDNSAKTIAVAVEELRRRMYDHVRSQCERLLEIGRHEGIVDNQQHLFAPADRTDGAEIADPHQRIRRGFDMHHASVLTDGALNIPGVGRVDI